MLILQEFCFDGGMWVYLKGEILYIFYAWIIISLAKSLSILLEGSIPIKKENSNKKKKKKFKCETLAKGGERSTKNRQCDFNIVSECLVEFKVLSYCGSKRFFLPLWHLISCSTVIIMSLALDCEILKSDLIPLSIYPTIIIVLGTKLLLNE